MRDVEITVMARLVAPWRIHEGRLWGVFFYFSGDYMQLVVGSGCNLDGGWFIYAVPY